MSENLYLVHHGVKGMKWGVRRTPEQLGHPTNKRALRKEKRMLKKQIVSARKANGGRFQPSTGKNFDAVRKEHQEAYENDKDLNKWLAKEEKWGARTEEAYNRSNVASDYLDRVLRDDTASELVKDRARKEFEAAKEAENHAESKYQTARYERYDAEERIAALFEDRYKDAAVKDLGFDDVAAGRALLEKHKLMRKASGANMYGSYTHLAN